MIIKGPACQTKFAVDQALLQAVSRPRFQCSQCGKYFDGSQVEPTRSRHTSASTTNDFTQQTVPNPSPEQLSLLERSAGEQNQPFTAKAPIPFPHMGNASPAWPSASSAPTQPRSSDQTAIKRVGPAQPTLAAPTQPVVEKRLLSSFTDKVAAWPQGNTQPAFTSDIEAQTSTQDPSQDSDRKSNRIRRSYKRKRTSRITTDESRSIGQVRASLDSPRKPFRSSYHKGSKLSFLAPLVLILIAPVLVFVALYDWSQNLESTPGSISALFSLENKKTLQVPPMTGLEVIDTSSRLIVLDDGSKLLEIRGTVLNSTVESFYQIQLEAKTYDANNQVINTKVVPAINGLSNATEVRSLRHSSIKALQRKAALGNAELKPNSSADFRLMLRSSPQMAWYSVRVYSVGKPK